MWKSTRELVCVRSLCFHSCDHVCFLWSDNASGWWMHLTLQTASHAVFLLILNPSAHVSGLSRIYLNPPSICSLFCFSIHYCHFRENYGLSNRTLLDENTSVILENLVYDSSTVVLLCSVSKDTRYKTNVKSVAWFLPEMAYFSMVFILHLTDTLINVS